MRYTSLAFFLTLAACGGGGGSSPPPSPPTHLTPTIADVTAFLVTSRCPDGMPAVVEPGCTAARQRASDVMLFRRHDWSHSDGQIEDAYANDDGSAYINTFSYPPNGGPFAPNNGDGGDVLVASADGRVRIDFTQNGDGAGGTRSNYWAGANCGGTGWLSFTNLAPTGSWNFEIAHLNGAATSTSCPGSLNPAFTQWRLETASVPFVMPDGSRLAVSLPVVISEHYAGTSIAGARSMERVIMAQGVGRVLWEAWTTQGPGATFPCPGIAGWSDPPAPGWFLGDRRCVTQIAADTGALTGDRFAWP